ncbi:RNA cytosine-C(5)-methyltransferase NSUN2 [Euphorbia peplus]|nr:RNA cytosine-C(5)-methyltransferase NSUN2 [Euphorbia peplus]
MGGRNRSRTQRKHFRDGRENVWKRPKSDSSSAAPPINEDRSWKPFATENAAFNEYYKEQCIVAPEEWDSFVQFLRTPLPSAFRINSSSQFCTDIRLQLENDFSQSLQAESTDGVEVEPIRPLPWYPNNLAWQSNFSRMQLRKNQTLERFHEFLKLENEIGNITRQEAVSMVPPLFLDVHPNHFVLDMCAAPGSKTFQLLEIIYQSTKPGSLPDGMVTANDLDVQRCNLLIHQTKRMCTANLIVTNNEAQHFPACRLNKSSAKASEIEFEPPISQLHFDRVLCDVPCSGDGTLRKAPDLWRKWSPGMGNGLHVLQLQIAMRGLSLLKVGGRMVYSTCSMNPVENEAVVAEILRKCEGSVELVDVSSDLPQLVRRPGLRKWKVRDKDIWLSSHKDVYKFRRFGIHRSMFPSGKSYVAPVDSDQKDENGSYAHSEDEAVQDSMISTDDVNEEEVSDLPLERCMRIVPQDQNSGAFFVAVLHKLLPLPVIPEKPSRRRNFSMEKSKLSENVSDQVTEVTVVPELNMEDATAEKNSEAASESDLVEDEPDQAALEPDTCNNTSEKSDSEKAQDMGKMETETQSGNEVGKRKLQTQGRWKGVDPVLFFNDEVIINSIKAFYGIDESFPFNGHLISRNLDNNHVKRIYYVSKSIKDVLELNLKGGQQLKISSVGLKMFERQTSREGNSAPCSFRISSEGLPVILPHVTKQILCASPVDFKHLLQYKGVKYSDFVNSEFGEKASKLMMGCCVIILGDGKSSPNRIEVDASTIAIGCWKGRSSLSVMVTAIDCEELLQRLSVRMEKEESSPVQENIGQVKESPDMNGNGRAEESKSIQEEAVING